MNTFWILAATLALAAALFVAVPLWRRGAPAGGAGSRELALAVYREQLAELAEERRSGRLDESEFARAGGEIERRVIEELPPIPSAPATGDRPRGGGGRGAAVAALAAVPLAGVLLYLALGHPGALHPRSEPVGHGLGQQQLDVLVERLAARLQKEPQDARGWAMLARAQTVLGQFGQASEAYAHAVALLPNDAQMLADYADTAAMAQGGRLRGQPEWLIDRALLADPANAKALALAGSAAFERKEYANAVRFWQRLRDLVPPDSEFGAAAQRNIDEARGLALASSPRAGRTAAPQDESASTRR